MPSNMQLMFTNSLGAGVAGREMETRVRTAGQEAMAVAPQPLLPMPIAAPKAEVGAPCGALTESSGVGHTETAELERQLHAAAVCVALSVAEGEGELRDDLLPAGESEGGTVAEAAPEAVFVRVGEAVWLGEALERALKLSERENEGEALVRALALHESETLAEALGEGEALCERDALVEALGEGEAPGVRDALAGELWDANALGERDAMGGSLSSPGEDVSGSLSRSASKDVVTDRAPEDPVSDRR